MYILYISHAIVNFTPLSWSVSLVLVGSFPAININAPPLDVFYIDPATQCTTTNSFLNAEEFGQN